MNERKLKNNVVRYFAITFFITWLLWLPGVIDSQTSLSIPDAIVLPLAYIGMFIPSLIGITFVIKEKQYGIFKKWMNIRLGWYWLIILFLIPLCGLGAHLVNIIVADGTFPEMPNLLLLPLQFIALLLIGGPVNEEFGWRGYALPKLQTKFTAFTSSILLGVIWVIWHVPAFFIDEAPQAKLPFVQFSITLIAVSVLMTWVQNNTGQSLWPALILHTTMNFTNEIFPLFNSDTNNYTPWIFANIILVIVTLIVILYYGTDLLPKKVNEYCLRQ